MGNWEVEGTKHFKALFVDFVEKEVISFMESHGFKKSKIATFKRKVGAKIEEFVVDGFTAGYIGYDLPFYITFPKFNKFDKELNDYSVLPYATTRHRISHMNGLELLKNNDIDIYFDLENVNDFQRASVMIRNTFERVVLPLFTKLDGLLSVRDFLLTLDLDAKRKYYDFATIPLEDVIHKTLLITKIFEPNQAEQVEEHFKSKNEIDFLSYYSSDRYEKLKSIDSEVVSNLLASEK